MRAMARMTRVGQRLAGFAERFRARRYESFEIELKRALHDGERLSIHLSAFEQGLAATEPPGPVSSNGGRRHWV